MFFTAQQVRNLDESALVSFLDRCVSECTGFVDYKRDYFGRPDDASSREQLKDVSSFANAEGGHILIGVDQPTREGAGADFLVGLDDGIKLAKAIEERCAHSIDPPIPGLLTFPVALANGKHVVVVHIPPSPVRPHMVSHQQTKTQTFFIRHSETTQVMTSADVRQAVLRSASGHQTAMEYLAQHGSRLNGEHAKGRCAMLVQAAPLIPVETLWDVTAQSWLSALMGSKRKARRRLALISDTGRRPSIEGAVMFDRRDDPRLVYEVHRSGYVGALVRVDKRDDKPQFGPYFFPSHSDLFDAVADLCDEALAVAGSDRPYALTASIWNTKGAVLCYDPTWGDVSQPISRTELEFPSLRRDSGESFVEVVQQWKPIFANAFGLEYSADTFA